MESRKMSPFGAPSKNVLTVKSQRKDNQVVVTITDTGNGIPHDIRHKIFEPFFTTKEVGGGTGLGLSISYGIVKDYNGTIEVDSEEAKGSTFTVSFPACDDIEERFEHVQNSGY
jgi:signal transduction histidine kinase